MIVRLAMKIVLCGRNFAIYFVETTVILRRLRASITAPDQETVKAHSICAISLPSKQSNFKGSLCLSS